MTGSRVELNRFILIWLLLILPLPLFWAAGPFVPRTFFLWGQVVVLMASWKVAALLTLTSADRGRMTWWRYLAFAVWPGMQPRRFLRGATPPPGAPQPTAKDFAFNLMTAIAGLWLVPRLLPSDAPVAARPAIAIVGLGALTLFVRLDLDTVIFRRLGFAVEKPFDDPFASRTLGEFWGRRWNRIVSGLLREAIHRPVARAVGPRAAVLAAFLYSGFYHETISVIAGAGYGRPTLYFLIQFVGVAAESTRPVRSFLRRSPAFSRLWTAAVILLPLGLLVPRGLLDSVLIPILIVLGVPGVRGGSIP